MRKEVIQGVPVHRLEGFRPPGLGGVSGGVCPVPWPFSCSVICTTVSEFCIFRLGHFTSLYLWQQVLFPLSAFWFSWLAVCHFRNFFFCFDSFFHFGHRPLCALKSLPPLISAPDPNEWLGVYGLARWSTPWPLNSPLLCCSARGQLQDHRPLWSFNNALNPCQQTYTSFSCSPGKVSRKRVASATMGVFFFKCFFYISDSSFLLVWTLMIEDSF